MILNVVIDVMGSQAGYIKVPAFEPGSRYMPFSNQLDFLGNPVPYWYYVSGNNIQKEQVPSREEMEEDLGNFVENRINGCEFENYYEQGYEINIGNSKKSAVNIGSDSVEINLDMDLTITKGNETASIDSHEISVNSKLGTLYNSAREIYDYEQETLFLEKYGVDTLRLYAPVDGVEIQCAPLTWNANEILDNVLSGVQENTLTLSKGSKTLADGDEKYFLQDLNVEGDVRFINSKNWPYTFEIAPTQGNLLISNPIGNQPGLGILGFCYVPYHYVYDLKYPVLIQIQQDDEIFQFPVAIVIQGNNPREALNVTAVERQLPEICEQRNTEIQVNLYDTRLNPVDANISYECFGTSCQIGQTSSGLLQEKFPQCVNGFIITKAGGFKDKKYQTSTVNNGSVEIILDRTYETTVNLKLDGREYNKDAMITFVSEDDIQTVVYPEQRTVKLAEGQYEIQAYVYRNTSLTIPATTSEQCVDIPSSGIGGFFGFTKEKCFNVDFPSQIVSNSLSGGGKQNYFILESQLINSNSIEINAQSLPIPTSIEQLQTNYILFEENNLAISFT